MNSPLQSLATLGVASSWLAREARLRWLGIVAVSLLLTVTISTDFGPPDRCTRRGTLAEGWAFTKPISLACFVDSES
jgi:hypothetical protein